jgi:hypothetical protein
MWRPCLSVREPVHDLVRATKLFMRFSLNSVPELFSDSCQAGVYLVQIGTVTALVYWGRQLIGRCSFKSNISLPIWLKLGTDDRHVMFSN